MNEGGNTVVRKRYTGRNRGFGRAVFVFLLVIVLAIGAGYISTNYIISPYLLGQKNDKSILKGLKEKENDKSKEKQVASSEVVSKPSKTVTEPSKEETSKVVNDHEGVKNTQTIKLYCIQYGSFKEKGGADEIVSKLKASNIDVSVIPNDGSYKVVGIPYMQEEKAREALQTMKAVAGEGIFITTMEARME